MASKASEAKTTGTTDDDRLQAVVTAIGELWTDLRAELERASNERVARNDELRELLAERAELHERMPDLEAKLSRLPGELTRADLEGDAESEGEIRRAFNEASGEMDGAKVRLEAIDTRLRDLGYSTTVPNPERAQREAEDSIRRDAEQSREDASDVVDYQRELLSGLITDRANDALLRVSEAEQRRSEQTRKQAATDAREQRAREVYGERTSRTLETVEKMPQGELAEDQPREPATPGYPGYGPL